MRLKRVSLCCTKYLTFSPPGKTNQLKLTKVLYKHAMQKPLRSLTLSPKTIKALQERQLVLIDHPRCSRGLQAKVQRTLPTCKRSFLKQQALDILNARLSQLAKVLSILLPHQISCMVQVGDQLTLTKRMFLYASPPPPLVKRTSLQVLLANSNLFQKMLKRRLKVPRKSLATHLVLRRQCQRNSVDF